jgi:hypothetical protein
MEKKKEKIESKLKVVVAEKEQEMMKDSSSDDESEGDEEVGEFDWRMKKSHK